MNYIKAQKHIFNEIISGSRGVAKFSIDENRVLVTPNAYMAYIFPKSIIEFSTDKVKDINPFPVLDIIKPENELHTTQDLRIDECCRKMYRRLKGRGKSVFINTKFLECFQNPKFYQEQNKLGTVVVTEGTAYGGKGSTAKTENPVGIVLPVRSSWDDGTYYSEDAIGAAHE